MLFRSLDIYFPGIITVVFFAHFVQWASPIQSFKMLPYTTAILCLLMESPTLVQDCQTLNLNKLQMQVFHELQGKLKEILLAIKALEKAQ